MTTDETTIEKRLEKAVFDKLKDDPVVLDQTQRLEILVLRENSEETKILMYGELKVGSRVDTAIGELELSNGWQSQEFDNIVDSLVNRFKNTLENMKAFS